MKRTDITTDNRFLQSSTLSKRGTRASTISQTGEQGCYTDQQHGHSGGRGGVAAVTVAVAVPALESVGTSALQALAVDLSRCFHSAHVQAAARVLLVDVHLLLNFEAHCGVGIANLVILAANLTRAISVSHCVALEALNAQSLLYENREDEDGTEDEVGGLEFHFRI